jgi:hypothetical protein
MLIVKPSKFQLICQQGYLNFILPEFWLFFNATSQYTQGNHAAHAALGFSKHLGGDVDGAIDSYHEALSRKPEDAFTSEMLLRALSEAVTYPPSLAMLSSLHPGEEVDSGGVGSSILKKMESGFADNKRPVPPGYYDHDDVDMSLVWKESSVQIFT